MIRFCNGTKEKRQSSLDYQLTKFIRKYDQKQVTCLIGVVERCWHSRTGVAAHDSRNYGETFTMSTHLFGPSGRGLVGKDATHCMDPFPLWKKWQQHQGNSGKQRGCARVADEKAR